jgi:pimeloyl-ACP methyl ester carboxylesterase
MTVHEWPGTGPEPATDELNVTSMIAFARERADADSVLFGHSMNARLVLAAAAAAPCAGVIAVAPPHPHLTADVMKAYWDDKAEPERKARAERAASPEVTQSLRYFYDDDHVVPGPEEWVIPGGWVAGVGGSFAAVDWDATLAAVRVPVFLALGEYDFVATPQPWLDESPRAGWTRELFTRSGHAPFMDEPDAFVAALNGWLATL